MGGRCPQTLRLTVFYAVLPRPKSFPIFSHGPCPTPTFQTLQTPFHAYETIVEIY